MDFTITENINKRIDKYLSKKLNITRNQIQKMIKDKSITVNNQKISPNYILKPNDFIKIRKNIKKTTALDPDFKLPIIYNNKDYLVLNKPANLLTHPDNSKNPSLLDYVIHNYPEVKNIEKNTSRPGIVHRLDKNVSGAIVIAKTKKMYTFLKNQFKSRQIEKHYITLVYGKISPISGVINIPIHRSKTDPTKMAASFNTKGKEAITKYETIKIFNKYSLLYINLITGRPHQIRVHMKTLGHSIVGDKKYKTKDRKIKEQLSQIFLHCKKLGFYDLNQHFKEFNAPLPKELISFLKNIK
jgi:23S rRNA pseudouridine1911/1915/1917 synthase